MAEKGIDGGKLKVGLDMDEDLRRLGIVKDALSRNNRRPYPMIDCNEYWSPKMAIQKVSEFERHFDIFWIEEPARRWDYEGLRQVSRAVRASVATGENLKNAGDFYPLIANRAADVYNVSAQGQGGVTGCMQIAATWSGRGRRMAARPTSTRSGSRRARGRCSSCSRAATRTARSPPSSRSASRPRASTSRTSWAGSAWRTASRQRRWRIG
jgi:L-alanine-DL-glutamate epimerase-like enolase superfamily enzyme